MYCFEEFESNKNADVAKKSSNHARNWTIFA